MIWNAPLKDEANVGNDSNHSNSAAVCVLLFAGENYVQGSELRKVRNRK